MNRGHCSPCPGLHFKAFHCGIVNVGSCERALSPAGRESTFLRSRLFSVLNLCPMAGCSFVAKTSPKMEAVFLGLHHYNTTAALSCSPNLHLVGLHLVGAWLMDGFTVSLLSRLKAMNPSPYRPFLQTTATVLRLLGCLTIIFTGHIALPLKGWPLHVTFFSCSSFPGVLT